MEPLAALSQREVQDRIRFLVDEHILELTDGQYPVLRCGERAEDVAYSDGPLDDEGRSGGAAGGRPPAGGGQPLTERAAGPLPAAAGGARPPGPPPGRAGFCDFLRQDPAEMAAAQPRDLRQLQNVGGVGSFKAEQYGAQFLEIISDFQETAA